MLVDRGRHVRCHLAGERQVVAGAVRPRGEDAGQLYLVADGAVEVEVPEEPVLVVADGVDGAHHQAARAAHLGGVGVPVEVLPADAEVLLVDADGIGRGHHRAVVEHLRRVEVDDLAQAVAAQLQGVVHQAEAELSRVERVLERLRRPGVAVGHHHLGQRRPVDDGPHPAPVVVGDAVQHQALGVVHDHTHRPLLPAQLVVVEREAGAFGLGDLDGAQIGAHGPEILGDRVHVVVAALGGHRPLVEVGDVQHFQGVDVDMHHQSVERVRVAVVRGIRAPEGDAALHAPAYLEVEVIVAGGPGVDLHLRRIGDAALGECSGEPRVLPAGVHHGEQLCHAHPRHRAPMVRPRVHLAAGHRHHGHMHFPVLVYHHLESPIRGGAWRPRGHLGLGWLPDAESVEPGAVADAPAASQYLDGGLRFRFGHHRQRVAARRRGGIAGPFEQGLGHGLTLRRARPVRRPHRGTADTPPSPSEALRMSASPVIVSTRNLRSRLFASVDGGLGAPLVTQCVE